MTLSYVKLPNAILEINLTAGELAVLFYLLSIYTGKGDTVCVKHSTIAWKCGFKTTQTVSRITTSLSDKGLITQRRCVYENNITGMIFYTMHISSSVSGEYFFVDRRIFNEGLTAMQLKVYLHICRALSPSLGKCWNSYNDLAKLIGISRSKAIELVAQLVQKNVIRKQRIKTSANKRVYGDTHYMIVRYSAHRPIRKKANKKIGLPSQKNSPDFCPMIMLNNHILCLDNITASRKSQVESLFLTSRGSPQNRRSIY